MLFRAQFTLISIREFVESLLSPLNKWVKCVSWSFGISGHPDKSPPSAQLSTPFMCGH